MRDRRLPTKLDAYQNQCFDGDIYTGFRCPELDPNCPIKKADGLDCDKALQRIGGHIELDHHDGCRFSKVHRTLAEDVVVRCSACHTRRHANDPSASRLPWRD